MIYDKERGDASVDPVINSESFTVRILKYVLPFIILILAGLLGWETFNTVKLKEAVSQKEKKSDSLSKILEYTREQLSFKNGILEYISATGDSILHRDTSQGELYQSLYNIRYRSGLRFNEKKYK